MFSPPVSDGVQFELHAPLHSRAASEGDQSFLDLLYRSTRHELALAGHDEGLLLQLLRLQQRALAQGISSTYPSAQTLILLRQGESIGQLAFESAANRLHLIDMALLPSAQGQGTGTAVVRALQSLAASRGTPLTLSVNSSNVGARRLYQRLAFEVVAHDAMQLQLRWQSQHEAAGT
jgi:ribosomal protein S18 acetylase RimI-like enzyme